MGKKDKENAENGFWADGFFAESVDPNDKDKMKTFHMKHDEEMKFDCSKCNAKISAHNKDWHGGMCDGCFNKEFFPERMKNR